MTDWAEGLRYAVALLAATSAGLLTATVVVRWESYPKRLRRTVPWFVALLLTITYGAGEAAHENAPPGLRVALTALVLAGLTASLLWSLRDPGDEHDPPPTIPAG